MSDITTEPTWRRSPPDAEGWWIRVNAINNFRFHLVYRSTEETLQIEWEETLQIEWETISGRWVVLDASDEKLKGWWWYGPIPVPPRVTGS